MDMYTSQHIRPVSFADDLGLATAHEIIEEARNGRMFILVDDEDRENEGDLIIPAQMATPDAINFMATHGRGLICLALTEDRSNALGLDMMCRNNRCANGTAFTVSIEARSGVSTGISAADRARTIATAINSANGPDEIVTPGHVFPLVARDGGVLVRAGHTEAAVDVPRMAGLLPAGMICEIMNEDGSMARLGDLIPFARRHGLKIGTIRDLIAHRWRNEHLVERVCERSFASEHGGEWTIIIYRNRIDGSETVAFRKGQVDGSEPTLVRMHAISILSDLVGECGPRNRLLQRSMEQIGEAGNGVIVMFTHTGQRTLRAALEAEPNTGQHRNYGIGAQVLADLGVKQMVLLTNSHHSVVGLDGFGLSIVEERPILG
jgi:3,4-dihydroxy 2-butanone 4-phosphate synthase/GTP cyclohydrolase II